MIDKEISEIRRSLAPERHAIAAVHGCYINGEGEIITTFCRSMSQMEPDEAEKYLALFKKTLSGALDRNLLDIPFSTAQVVSAEEHKLLSTLRAEALENEETLRTFWERIAASHTSTGNYCVLLALNRYDVPYRGKDGAKYEDAGEETYTYLTCAICPVKTTKSGLTYDAHEKAFCNYSGDSAILPPEVGFLFPAFDDRKTNIYSTLFYTKSIKDTHEALTESLFGGKIELAASAQGEVFRTVLGETLDGDCSFAVARAVHTEISALLAEHKEQKIQEPLLLSQTEVRAVLEHCGVPAENAEKFDEAFVKNFGAGTDVVPRNIITPKKFEIKTPDVVIKVAAGSEHLVETRTIDGVAYLCIPADGGVELNGMNVKVETNN